ncbi:MAG: NAD(P)-dependent glycerol-3-phosphate dehydrogenase [Rhizobiales bacterium]|nr:NAD(P)-dependent glycerol-3-phosphate dehydrogenase [Hyphomicrobiales bacterium]
MAIQRIAVIGAGAWGVALANAAARAGRDAILCARDDATASEIARTRESARLPGVRLADTISVTANRDEATRADALLLAIPAQELDGVARSFASALQSGTPVVACAKGIDRATRRFMTEIVTDALPQARAAILSGPSFASDVARGLPTAVTLAAADEDLAAALAAAIGSPTFRLYHTSDVRGVEIGGAAKNVLAIAAGIAHGKKLGASAVAALTTRGFAELSRFAHAYGVRTETLMGLSCLGDLVLSCASVQSRNFAYGVALGEGKPNDGKLAEGAFTASVLVAMADAKSIEMPIAKAVAAVLDQRLSVNAAIDSLLTRPMRAEG